MVTTLGIPVVGIQVPIGSVKAMVCSAINLQHDLWWTLWKGWDISCIVSIRSTVGNYIRDLVDVLVIWRLRCTGFVNWKKRNNWWLCPFIVLPSSTGPMCTPKMCVLGYLRNMWQSFVRMIDFPTKSRRMSECGFSRDIKQPGSMHIGADICPSDEKALRWKGPRMKRLLGMNDPLE